MESRLYYVLRMCPLGLLLAQDLVFFFIDLIKMLLLVYGRFNVILLIITQVQFLIFLWEFKQYELNILTSSPILFVNAFSKWLLHKRRDLGVYCPIAFSTCQDQRSCFNFEISTCLLSGDLNPTTSYVSV